MPLTDAQIDYEREPIPYTPVKRLERGPLYVRKLKRPHPILGYGNSHDEYSVIDLRGYRKGYEPRLEILGVYTPNPHDLFRVQTGHLPPYQPTTTGDKLQAEMERLGSFQAWRILPSITSPSTHPLILKQYPLGEVPEKISIGGLEIPVPPPKVVSENAAIRTDERLDKIVEHLGYQSITLSEEELASLDRAIPTDIDIISEAQKRLKEAEVIPDSKLDAQQLAHLNLARAIASHALLDNPVLGIYAASIPPASDRVRTAGMYGTSTKTIYLSLDMLPRCRSTVDTLVHELGHHQQHTKEDLTPEHAKAMTEIAARVVEDVAKGTFDEQLKEVSW